MGQPREETSIPPSFKGSIVEFTRDKTPIMVIEALNLSHMVVTIRGTRRQQINDIGNMTTNISSSI